MLAKVAQPAAEIISHDTLLEVAHHLQRTDGASLRQYRLVSSMCNEVFKAVTKDVKLVFTCEKDWTDYFEPFDCSDNPDESYTADASGSSYASRRLAEISRITSLHILCVPPPRSYPALQKAEKLALSINPNLTLFYGVEDLHLGDALDFGSTEPGIAKSIGEGLDQLFALLSPRHIHIDLERILSPFTQADSRTEATFVMYLEMTRRWAHPFYLLKEWIARWQDLRSISWLGVPYRSNLCHTFPGIRNDFHLATLGEAKESIYRSGNLLADFVSQPFLVDTVTTWRFFGLLDEPHDRSRRIRSREKDNENNLRLVGSFRDTLCKQGWGEDSVDIRVLENNKRCLEMRTTKLVSCGLCMRG